MFWAPCFTVVGKRCPTLEIENIGEVSVSQGDEVLHFAKALTRTRKVAEGRYRGEMRRPSACTGIKYLLYEDYSECSSMGNEQDPSKFARAFGNHFFTTNHWISWCGWNVDNCLFCNSYALRGTLGLISVNSRKMELQVFLELNTLLEKCLSIRSCRIHRIEEAAIAV
jgi:hypothetical protein